MVTKVLAYNDARFSLVFPKPDVMTTVSYWTGTYPSIRGPDWTDLPLTTRFSPPTPLSEVPTFASGLPSFTLLHPSSKEQLTPITEPLVSPFE